MKNYAPENAAFQLPFQFDNDRLLKDLETCKQFNFLQNYVPANYHGKDYILPLRAIDGKMNFPGATPGNADRFQDTEALKACPYFQEIINQFQCEKEAARLMSLPPGAIINPHTDHSLGYEDGVFRVHIPIMTNPDVHFILNDERIIMQAAEAWYTNVNLTHSVRNEGTTHRVHFVVDCIRNAWSDELFGTLGYRFDLEHEAEEQLSEDTMANMLRELEQQDNPAAKALIAQLRSQLSGKSN